jgi:methyl-accepting chemotaxis protein
MSDMTAAADVARIAGIAAALLSTLLALGIALLIARSITRGLAQLRGASAGIAAGDLEQQVTLAGRDELGQVADSFRQMIDYLHGLAQAAEALAANDLTIEVEPKSEADVLSRGFVHLIESQREMVGELRSMSGVLLHTSTSVTDAAGQNQEATTQVAAAVQQMAAGSVDLAHSTSQARDELQTLRGSAERGGDRCGCHRAQGGRGQRDARGAEHRDPRHLGGLRRLRIA